MSSKLYAVNCICCKDAHCAPACCCAQTGNAFSVVTAL